MLKLCRKISNPPKNGELGGRGQSGGGTRRTMGTGRTGRTSRSMGVIAALSLAAMVWSGAEAAVTVTNLEREVSEDAWGVRRLRTTINRRDLNPVCAPVQPGAGLGSPLTPFSFSPYRLASPPFRCARRSTSRRTASLLPAPSPSRTTKAALTSWTSCGALWSW